MRLLLGAILALTTLFFALTAALVRDWAAPPPGDSHSFQIIFASNPVSGSGVLSSYSRIMNADGSDVKILDFGTTFSCSPDGRYLAFWKDGWQIANADGTNLRSLAMYINPFSRVVVTNSGIVVAISQPTDHQTVGISREPDGVLHYPVLPFATTAFDLSADSRRMAFSVFFPPYGAYIANSDGSDLTEVRSGNIQPAWSPDDRDILSFSDADYLYLTDVQRILTLRLTQAAIMGAGWSPDGSTVAFVRDFEIFTRDLGTGEERQLTNDKHATLNTWPCFLSARPLSLVAR